MIESLILSIADDQLYQHHDFCDRVSNELSNMADPFAIVVASPKQFDKSKGLLPILIASKENSADQKRVNLESHGYLLFSAVKTGELLSVKIGRESKQPLYDDEEAEARMLKMAPPGYTPKVSTNYDCEYRDLTAQELPPIGSQWVLAINAINSISNTQSLSLDNDSISAKNSEFYQVLSNNESSVYSGGTLFSVHDDSPEFPNDGFNIAFKSSQLVYDNPYIIYVSFDLEDDDNDAFNFIPVHVLIGTGELENTLFKQILVPKSQTTQKEGRVQGWFTIDLSAELLNQHTGLVSASENIFVSMVSRATFSRPFKVY